MDDPMKSLVPRLKAGGYDRDRVDVRRRWLEERTGCSLRHVGSFSIDSETLRGNIENPIGVAQVPLGVAGPLLVRGHHANGVFYVPLATSEGALVRSYERGMVALTRAGGVETCIVRDENQMNPSFFLDSISEISDFVSWLHQNFDQIKKEADSTTRHGKLTSLNCYPIGNQVIVNLGFDTGDAQGMNMIVKATDKACRWIESNYPVNSFFIFSGMSSEKRPSGFLLSRGKGKWVTAGAFVPEGILKTYMGCSASQLHAVWQSTVIGHLSANAVGYNGQFANGLTAMFIATGQDVANVVNSACGVTNFQLVEGGIHASLTLPALEVATVGGGTALGSQKECLEMIGCVGSGKARKLAEIVAAALLGGEISMGSAIASGEFATAHERYGRNRPVEGEV
jgi:hydroxymethylglutaryl-CoA reductase (NADPH)